MLCPHCRAYNPNSALVCERCAKPLVQPDSTADVTFAGDRSPVPAAVAPSGGSAAGGARSAPSSPVAPSASLVFSFEPGSDFGPRYRIEAVLGEGGMGTVYKAHDKELNRSVALKLIRPGLMADESALQRFKQELLLASKISHKNILRIHDLGEVQGLKFISMAFIEGEDLHRVLHLQGRLPVERTVKIARQLLEALDAAHAEGVVHRDLKPQNILVDRAEQIYVSDFGLAKSLHASTAGMTRAGEFLGTPRYMAPEQVEGKPVDNRTDLYAVGLILYEMVTGDVPFKADSTLALMFQRVKEKPRNPKTLNPDLPDYLVRIILRCLETDPAQRYQSAREALADLEAQRAPVRARSVQIALPVPTSRGGLISAGVVLALLLGALAVPQVRHFLFRGRGAAAVATGIPPLSEGKFLAVLPFRVLGDDQSLAYIADGMVEALSAKLFQLKEIRLASASAAGAAGKPESLEKIARRLGANLIVQGMVQSAGGKVRVIVNLDDAASSKRLWSHEFSGLAQDLLTLEDQIYGQLVTALELNPSAEERARGSSRPTENIEAYDLYLKGRNSLRGQQDVRNVEAAIRFFEDALKKDTGFALAYAGLADSNLVMYREKKDQLWAQKALGAAQRARELNDALPEVHFSLGSVYVATGKSAEAVAELKRALELAPNSDEGFRRLAQAYKSLSQKDEAIQAYKKAIETNPYYWFNHNALGAAYLEFGDNEKALAEFKRVTELEPENSFGWENMGTTYIRQGKWQESIQVYEKALTLQQNYSTYSNVGTAYFFLKDYDKAVKMYEKAVEMNPNDSTAMGNLGDALRWSGQKDRANATYDKAIALGYKDLQVNPRNAAAMGNLALFYAKKGDKSNASDFIRRARSIDRHDVYLTYSEALVHALAGRTPDALRSLRQAFQSGYPAQEAVNDPELKNLQSLPEFDKLVKEFSAKH
jgi:serine/threonine-protein kinase